MSQLISKNPIVTKIADESAKEDILDMLIDNELPFTEEEKLESLVFVMKLAPYKDRALKQLKGISESVKSQYVDKKEANHRVAFYILLECLNYKRLEATAKIIKNPYLPYEFLIKIAEKGTIEMLEMLLDNQIKLIAYPEIMDGMIKNPAVTNFILGRIKEIKDFYLSMENAEKIEAEDVLEYVKETILQEQLEENADENEALPENLDDLQLVEEKALTTLQEINQMNIAERIKLALQGSKTHRMILIKDPNRMVAMAVVESPKLSPDEVVMLVKNKSISGEIIGKLANNREWTKSYPIILELVQNPKTPIKSALSFIKKLHMKDLRQVSKSRNINPVIRTMALSFYSQKTGVKQ